MFLVCEGSLGMKEIDISAFDMLFNCIGNLSSVVFWVSTFYNEKQIYISPSYTIIYGQLHLNLYENPEAWSQSIILEDKYNVLQLLENRNNQYINGQDKTDPIYYRVLSNEKIHFIKNRGLPLRNVKGEVVARMGFSESLQEQQWESEQLSTKNWQPENQQILTDVSTIFLREFKITDVDIISPNTNVKSHKDHPLFNDPKIELSPREKDTLQCMIQGKSAKETGRILNLSHRTIETYLENIKQKLGCRTKLGIISKLHFIDEEIDK